MCLADRSLQRAFQDQPAQRDKDRMKSIRDSKNIINKNSNLKGIPNKLEFERHRRFTQVRSGVVSFILLTE